MTLNYLNKFVFNLLLFTYFFCINNTYSQPLLPQKTISVAPTQPMNFGVFYVTSAGTITVNWDGNVTTTGGVVAVSSYDAHPAIFDITLCQGRNVTISYNPVTTISNNTPITLNIGDTEKGPSGTSFPVETSCTFITTLRVGGTLDIPNGTNTGVYTGSFFIDFTQE